MIRTGVALLALGIGLLSLWGMVVLVDALTGRAESRSMGDLRQPVRITHKRPAPPPVQAPLTSPSTLLAAPAPAAPTRRPQRTPSLQPPRPAAPDLGLAGIEAARIGLPVPVWEGPSLTPTTDSRSSGPGGESLQVAPRKIFHWVYSPELTDPEAMTRAYPKTALRRGLSGIVNLRVVVDQSGRVVETKVVSSHPRGVFDACARRMVARWRGSCAGVYTQPVRFVHPDLYRKKR